MNPLKEILAGFPAGTSAKVLACLTGLSVKQVNFYLEILHRRGQVERTPTFLWRMKETEKCSTLRVSR